MGGGVPPEAMAQLAGILGDPMAAAGAAPVPGPADPMMGGGAPAVGPIPGLPSTDPGFVAQLQQQDIMAVQAAQQSAMATAAAGMGGVPPMPPAQAGMPGDPMAPPAQPPLGDPMMGQVGGVAGLPPELSGAYGGASYGAMEGDTGTVLPGDQFAGGAY